MLHKIKLNKHREISNKRKQRIIQEAKDLERISKKLHNDYPYISYNQTNFEGSLTSRDKPISLYYALSKKKYHKHSKVRNLTVKYKLIKIKLKNNNIHSQRNISKNKYIMTDKLSV